MPGVARVGATAVADLADAERRLDQRGVGLDVGAHDQDVARLERRVVGEQAEQHLAQHLDLAGRAVAGVHLDAAVVAGRAEREPGSGGGVGGEVGLEPAEQRAGLVRCGRPCASADRRRRSTTAASVRCSSRRSRPSEASRGWPTCSRDAVLVRAAPRPGSGGERLPEDGGGVRQPEVDLAVVAQGRQQLDLGRPGSGCGRRARTAAGRSAASGVGAQPSRRPSACRRPGSGAPTRARPGAATARAASQVGRERGRRHRRCRSPCLPAASSAGRWTAYDGEEARRGDARRRSGGRAAARPPRRSAPWPEVAARARRTRARRRGRRRRRAAATPGRRAPTGRRRRRAGDLGDQRAPASGTRRPRTRRRRRPAGAELVGQALAEPALDPAAGTSDQLLGERVGLRLARAARASAVGERVGARGAVQEQGHEQDSEDVRWERRDPNGDLRHSCGPDPPVASRPSARLVR